MGGLKKSSDRMGFLLAEKEEDSAWVIITQSSVSAAKLKDFFTRERGIVANGAFCYGTQAATEIFKNSL